MLQGDITHRLCFLIHPLTLYSSLAALPFPTPRATVRPESILVLLLLTLQLVVAERKHRVSEKLSKDPPNKMSKIDLAGIVETGQHLYVLFSFPSGIGVSG